MKYFKETLELIRRDDIITSSLNEKDKKYGHTSPEFLAQMASTKKELSEDAAQAEVFVFTPTTSGSEQLNPDEFSNEEVKELLGCIPFRTVSIEMAGGFLTTGDPNSAKFACSNIVLTKNEDGGMSLFFTIKHPAAGKVIVAADRDTPRELTIHYLSVAFTLLKRLRVDKIGRQKVSAKVKIGSGKDKVFRKIKRVLVVSPRKVQKLYEGDAESREIDWSQRWVVMGHYRYFYKKDSPSEVDYTRLGKNYNGDYCEAGRTWVVDHEKGPEDKALVKKTRVVTASSSSPILA